MTTIVFGERLLEGCLLLLVRLWKVSSLLVVVVDVEDIVMGPMT